MLFACRAWEGMYQGLHGIEALAILNVSDDKEKAEAELNDWGNYESEELIYSYGLEGEYYDENDEDCDITESWSYSDRG